MNVAEETLGFRRASLSLALSLLMSAFALPIPPAAFTSHLHRPTERSPTIRGQKTDDRGQSYIPSSIALPSIISSFVPSRAAFWRSPDTHRANAAIALALHS